MQRLEDKSAQELAGELIETRSELESVMVEVNSCLVLHQAMICLQGYTLVELVFHLQSPWLSCLWTHNIRGLLRMMGSTQLWFTFHESSLIVFPTNATYGIEWKILSDKQKRFRHPFVPCMLLN